MDVSILANICPDNCPWPCCLGIVANIIIVLAAIKFVVQYFRNR